MVTDWAAARADDVDAVMIALTHDAVAELNQRARSHLAATGQLGLTVAEVEDSGTECAIGDTVVCLRNNRRLGVRNGDLATVVGATDTGVIIDRAGQQTALPAAYLAAGHLDHGYALTVHKAQGATYDTALLYGDDHLYAEAGYTALTRGRHHNHAYVLTDQTADPQALARRLARPSRRTSRGRPPGLTPTRPVAFEVFRPHATSSSSNAAHPDPAPWAAGPSPRRSSRRC
jgi:ATP-dependent exoDNAse (exonuclease V) alpha subunit